MQITAPIQGKDPVFPKAAANQKNQLNFKDLLRSTKNNSTEVKTPTGSSPEPNETIQQIITEIRRLLESYFETNGLAKNDGLAEADQTEDVTYMAGDLQSIVKEIENLTTNSDSSSIDQSKQSYSLPIQIIGLAKGVSNGSLELETKDSIFNKLNILLNSEFQSYSTPEINDYENMLHSLGQMGLEDKALLESQIWLNSVESQTKNDLQHISKLLKDRSIDSKTLINMSRLILKNSGSNQHVEELLFSKNHDQIDSFLGKLVGEAKANHLGKVTPKQPLPHLIDKHGMVVKDLNWNRFSNGLDSKNMSNAQSIDVDVLSSKVEESFTVGKQQMHTTTTESVIAIQLDGFKEDSISQKTEPSLRAKVDFSNQLASIIRRGEFKQLGNGTNRLVIQLTPEHLGPITIKLVQQNGVMVAKIIAATQSAKELLDHSSQQLKQALPNVSVEVERFEIIVDEKAKPSFREQEQSKDQKGNNQPYEHRNDPEEHDTSFKESLEEALNITV